MTGGGGGGGGAELVNPTSLQPGLMLEPWPAVHTQRRLLPCHALEPPPQEDQESGLGPHKGWGQSLCRRAVIRTCPACKRVACMLRDCRQPGRVASCCPAARGASMWSGIVRCQSRAVGGKQGLDGIRLLEPYAPVSEPLVASRLRCWWSSWR